MLIEYPDATERAYMLTQLKGIERRVWVQVAGGVQVFAIADEDLERENAEKTSAVHFLRFELNAAMRQALRTGAMLVMGVDHPIYSVHTAIVNKVRAALLQDITD